MGNVLEAYLYGQKLQAGKEWEYEKTITVELQPDGRSTCDSICTWTGV